MLQLNASLQAYLRDLGVTSDQYEHWSAADKMIAYDKAMELYPFDDCLKNFACCLRIGCAIVMILYFLCLTFDSTTRHAFLVSIDAYSDNRKVSVDHFAEILFWVCFVVAGAIGFEHAIVSAVKNLGEPPVAVQVSDPEAGVHSDDQPEEKETVPWDLSGDLECFLWRIFVISILFMTLSSFDERNYLRVGYHIAANTLLIYWVVQWLLFSERAHAYLSPPAQHPADKPKSN